MVHWNKICDKITANDSDDVMDIYSLLKVLLHIWSLGNIYTHCRMGLNSIVFHFLKWRFRKRKTTQSYFCFLIQNKSENCGLQQAESL